MTFKWSCNLRYIHFVRVSDLKNIESVDQISRVDQIYLNLDQSFSCIKPTWFDQKSMGNFDIWLIPLPSQHQPECLETHLSIVRTPIWREGTESRPIPTPPGCLLAPCDTQSAACALALDICIVSGWVGGWVSEWVPCVTIDSRVTLLSVVLLNWPSMIANTIEAERIPHRQAAWLEILGRMYSYMANKRRVTEGHQLQCHALPPTCLPTHSLNSGYNTHY